MFRYMVGVVFLISIGAMASDASVLLDKVQVSDKIAYYRISSSMGNTSTVVYDDGQSAILIDPNFNNSYSVMMTEMFNNDPTRIKYIASSHDHRDHIEQYGQFGHHATVIVPHNQLDAVKEWGGSPSMAYDGKVTVLMGSEQIDFLTLPNRIGHTNGDQLVHFKSANVLYVGDYYFSVGYPIIDKHSGDLYGYINNLKYIAEAFEPNTTVLPGHTTFAPAAMTTHTLDDISVFASILEETASIVKQQMRQNKDLEEIQRIGLPDKFDAFDVKNSFKNEQRWIKYLYQYFSSEKAESQ